MKISEKLIEQTIIYALNKIDGIMCVKINMRAAKLANGGYAKMPIGCLRGTPDLIVMGVGFASYWIEVKKPGGVQSPEQEQFEDNCRQLGVGYYICKSKEEALATLETERNRNGK